MEQQQYVNIDAARIQRDKVLADLLSQRCEEVLILIAEVERLRAQIQAFTSPPVKG